jgi:phytanoyl-CoA hydroxylase
MENFTTMEITKFNLEQASEIKAYYTEHGYVVIRNAISFSKIDLFLNAYKKIKHNPFFVYYSQSIQRCVRVKLTRQSYISESMENASRLAFFPNFSKRIQDCIYDANVSTALQAVDGHAEHVSWQNMFFDRSTGTIEHQDSWYLDTDPPGNLIGAWFSLEDIQENCGSFFVCPGSHKLGIVNRKDYPTHKAFIQKIFSLSSEQQLEKKPMYLKKGDLLLWHPFLVHGAFRCQDDTLTRKSFTAHFYPRTCRAKVSTRGKLLSIYWQDHDHPRETSNPQIFTSFRLSDYLYNLMLYILFLKTSLKLTSTTFSMRRESYKQVEHQKLG